MSVLSFGFIFLCCCTFGTMVPFTLSPSSPPPLPHFEPVCSDVSCECHGKATELGKTKIELGGGLSTFLTALHLH